LGEIGALERAHDSGYDSSSDAELTGKDESGTEPINADEPMDNQSTNLCTNPRKSTMHTTHKWDIINNLRKMNDQLAGKPVTTLTPYKKKPFPKPKDEFKPVAVNIAAISANCMHFNMKREENEAFTTSLYEIDQIMEDRYRESEEYKLWAQQVREQIREQQEAAQRLTRGTVCEVDVANEEINKWEKVPECYKEFKAAFS